MAACRMPYASRPLPLPTTLSIPTLIPGTRALIESAAARDGRFSPDRPLQRSPDAGMCREQTVRNTRGIIELLEGVTDKITSPITRKLNHRHTSWPTHDPWLLIASSNKARKRASYKCSCFCSPCGAWGHGRLHIWVRTRLWRGFRERYAVCMSDNFSSLARSRTGKRRSSSLKGMQPSVASPDSLSQVLRHSCTPIDGHVL